MTGLRVMVLCCDGRYQRYLVARAAQRFDVVGVVWQTSTADRPSSWRRLHPYLNPLRLTRHIVARTLLPYFERRAQSDIDRLFGEDVFPTLSTSAVQVRTSNINDDTVVRQIRDLRPDIVLVNGTQLLRESILGLLPGIPHGILNLHTGLSPYSRGGNCNLFMLLERHPELLGVTIHHIDRGIDSGDIVRTAQLTIEAGDSYELLDARSFHIGVELLLRGAEAAYTGRAARVAQWEAGKLFLRRTGYVYEPWHRLRANLLVASGYLKRYLRAGGHGQFDVRLVGE